MKNMKAVGFVQERRSRRIIGAATIELHDTEPEKAGDGKR
jgi:hypothetical protein